MYNQIEVITPFKYPLCCWDQIDHFLGGLSFILASSLTFTFLLSILSRITRLNWKEKCLVLVSYSLFFLFWICVIWQYEIVRKNWADPKIIIFDILGLILGGVIILLLKNKILDS